MKINLSDEIQGIDIDDDNPDALFCSEYCAECLKRAGLNYDFTEDTEGRGSNNLHPTTTYYMDHQRTEEEGHTESVGGVKTEGGSYEYVGKAEEIKYKAAMEQLVSPTRVYKVAIETNKGFFAGTDASIFITLHDEDGNSSEEWDLNAGLYEHSGADADLSETGKAKVAGTSQADKTVTFEAGKTDYFFLEEYAHDMSRATGLSGEESGPEPQTAKPPLGDLAAITLRVEESGSASIKFSTDATVTFRVLKENFFDDWDCKWVGVTRLAIGGAGGETKQYSFPCSGTEAAQDFYKKGPLHPNAVKLPVRWTLLLVLLAACH